MEAELSWLTENKNYGNFVEHKMLWMCVSTCTHARTLSLFKCLKFLQIKAHSVISKNCMKVTTRDKEQKQSIVTLFFSPWIHPPEPIFPSHPHDPASISSFLRKTIAALLLRQGSYLFHNVPNTLNFFLATWLNWTFSFSWAKSQQRLLWDNLGHINFSPNHKCYVFSAVLYFPI